MLYIAVLMHHLIAVIEEIRIEFHYYYLLFY